MSRREPAVKRLERSEKLKVVTIYGTRPEAIKMAPVILELSKHSDVSVQIVVTGQHREMLDQVHVVFGLTPDVDLDIHVPGQTLTEITTRALAGLEVALSRISPDAVLVQGDTTTTFAAALAAFYHRVPVVHLEAGLRTNNPYSPFPEEVNRRLTTQLSALHLAPTSASAANLRHDGVPAENVVVTGNTVIDALLTTLRRGVTPKDSTLRWLDDHPERRVILVTVHRRESWGEPLVAVGEALACIAREYPDHEVVIPLHRNPIVRESVVPSVKDLPNVRVIEPLGYDQFCWLQQRSHLIVTDSGGVQEEAPSLGKPVLVLRENTERPEAVAAGTVKIIGTKHSRVVGEIRTLLNDPDAYARMARAVNPYGDGVAASRCAMAIRNMFGRGERPVPFTGSHLPGRTRPPGGRA